MFRAKFPRPTRVSSPAAQALRAMLRQNQGEMAQKWARVVRKLLMVSLQAASSLTRTILDHPVSLTAGEACQHPHDSVVRGANQYGTWARCVRCKRKLWYEAFSATNPQPKSRQSSGSAVTYAPAPKSLASMKSEKSKKGSERSDQISQKQLERALEQQAGYMVQGITAGITSALTPVLQGQQALHHTLTTAMGSAGRPQQYPIPPAVHHGSHNVTQHFQMSRPEEDQDMVNPNLTGWEHTP